MKEDYAIYRHFSFIEGFLTTKETEVTEDSKLKKAIMSKTTAIVAGTAAGVAGLGSLVLCRLGGTAPIVWPFYFGNATEDISKKGRQLKKEEIGHIQRSA